MKYLKILILSLVIISCQEDSITGIEDSSMENEAQFKRIKDNPKGLNLDSSALQYDNAEDLMEAMNSNLATNGLNIRFSKFEFLTKNVDNPGQIVFANNRELHLESRWVPYDQRRDADGSNITHLIGNGFGVGELANDIIDIAPPIDRSFESWDNGTKCSDMPIIKRELQPGMFPSIALYFFAGLPPEFGNPFIADIVTSGFLPGVFFDAISEDGKGSEYILGVTFTLVFVEGEFPDETPTDIDNNGYTDTALKEVWYNDSFTWSTDGTPNTIDIETVALHENGHALELGHMGKIFGTKANRKLHIAPRTVMNASYSGIQREVNGIANSAHCRNFGHWPNN